MSEAASAASVFAANSARAGVVGGLLGLLFFLAIYGHRILLPGETGWLMHGDPAQHYLGWAFFLSEPWQWPPGVIAGFGHPLTTSVVFTDSIPLLALPLKALTTVADWIGFRGNAAGESGQYFGAWMLLCYALLGGYSARLLARLGVAPVAAMLATALVLTSPALALRAYGHESLLAHWLIVAAFERYLAGWNARVWTALLLAALLIHAYWVVMLTPLLLAAFWQHRQSISDQQVPSPLAGEGQGEGAKPQLSPRPSPVKGEGGVVPGSGSYQQVPSPLAGEGQGEGEVPAPLDFHPLPHPSPVKGEGSSLGLGFPPVKGEGSSLQNLRFFALLLPLMAAAAWAAGYFTAAPRQLAAEGYGNYSANLLAWFDPMDWQAFLRHYRRDTAGQGEWSQLLPPLGQSTAGQYEGFAYLGAGMLALAAVAAILAVRGAFSGASPTSPSSIGRGLPADGLSWGLSRAPTLLPLAVAVTLLFAAGLSYRVGFATTEILALPLPEPLIALLSVFRASGRFIWPATYLLMFAVLVVVCRRGARFAPLLLAGALALQAFDLGDKWREFHQRFHTPAVWRSPLAADAWRAPLAGARHLFVLPARTEGDGWIAWAELALRHGMTVNLGPVARADEPATQQAEAHLLTALHAGALPADTAVVLLRSEDAEALATLAEQGKLRIVQVQDFRVVRAPAPRH